MDGMKGTRGETLGMSIDYSNNSGKKTQPTTVLDNIVVYASLLTLVFAFVSFFIPGLFPFIIGSIKSWVQLLYDKNPTVWNIAGVLTVLLLGYILYHFKKRWQMAYGIIEVSFSLTSCVYTINHFLEKSHKSPDSTSGPLAIFISLVGAVYLTNRGLTNFLEGRDKRLAQKDKENKRES